MCVCNEGNVSVSLPSPMKCKTNFLNVFILDQTPTPTRFLKNCEEVGLFNELASSFEQEFCKAHEDEQRTKHPVRKGVNVHVK